MTHQKGVADTRGIVGLGHSVGDSDVSPWTEVTAPLTLLYGGRTWGLYLRGQVRGGFR